VAVGVNRKCSTTVTPDSNYLIDSGIIMRHLRGDRRASALLRHLKRAGTVTTSVLVLFEVLRGCRTSGEEAAARPVFNLITTLDLDVATADMGARIARDHRAILNSDRATADALIAGTAYAHRATLVTLNTRQFSGLRIPGLNLLLIDQQATDWVPVIP